MADAGFFRLLLPQELGGAQLAHPDFLRILEMFAAADASVAWCLNQNNVFSTRSTRMDMSTAHEIWDERRGVVTNGPPAAGTKSVPVEGGYRLSGHWNFSSGSDHATWIAALAPVIPDNGTGSRGAAPADAAPSHAHRPSAHGGSLAGRRPARHRQFQLPG